jgi:predicted DNA-binding transcriptional regulator YafY
MNRMDRLLAILLLLQGGKRTAREIAQRFEVTKRTVLRDMQALCEIGIPIIAELGASGGYTLLSDYSLPPVALTLHEALLLQLALSSLSQLGETPFKQERESLLAKVQTLIPRHRRFEVNQLQQRLSLDVPTRALPTPFLDYLLESAHAGRWVAVTYRSSHGVSQQTLLPIHVHTSQGLWYCEAYSSEHREMRRYRVDRFLLVQATLAPELLEPRSIPPQEHSSFPEVCIRLTARGVLILESDQHLGPSIQRPGEEGGWLCERFPPQEYDWLVRVIMSLGVEAKVLAPEDLQKRVWQEIQNVARHYAER